MCEIDLALGIWPKRRLGSYTEFGLRIRILSFGLLSPFKQCVSIQMCANGYLDMHGFHQV